MNGGRITRRMCRYVDSSVCKERHGDKWVWMGRSGSVLVTVALGDGILEPWVLKIGIRRSRIILDSCLRRDKIVFDKGVLWDST